MSKRINLANYLRHKYLINGHLEDRAVILNLIHELEYNMNDGQFIKIIRTKRVKEILTSNKIND